MEYKYELRLNDNNGVSEDGTKFLIHRLNPDRGRKNQPEYIDEEIPIEEGAAWASLYKDAQSSWATGEERYHDELVKTSGVPVEDGEDPMEVMIGLIEDKKTNPEAILGFFAEQESEQRKRILDLLEEYKSQLDESWQELLFKMYNQDMRFSDMVREHEAKTGEKKSNQSYSKRHGKAINALKDKFEAAGYEVDRAPKRKKKNQ